MELRYSSKEVIPLPVVKLFLTGHIMAGKTALCRNFGGSQRKPRKSLHERAEKHKERTAGIEVENLEHELFGSVMAYDLAGHCQYTTSHSVVIDCGNNSIFLILYDINSGLQEANKQVNYWAAFIKAGRPKGSLPRILLIATHCDVALAARKTMESLRIIHSCVFGMLKKCYGKVFLLSEEQFIINCLDSTSQGMDQLRKAVGYTCKEIKKVFLYDILLSKLLY